MSTDSNTAKKRLTALVIALSSVVLAAGAIFVANLMSYEPVIEAYINGMPRGFVASEDDLPAALEALEAEISASYGEEISLGIELSHVETKAKKPKLLSAEDCAELIESAALDYWCEAYILKVDGAPAAANEDGALLDELIVSIENELKTEGKALGELQLLSALTVERGWCPREVLMTPDEAHEILLPDALSADAYGYTEVSVTPFAALAPADSEGIAAASLTDEPDDLSLDYYYTSTVTQLETLPYEVIEIEDPNAFIGYDRVFASGTNGTKSVTYDVIRDADGNELSRTEVSSEVVTPARARVAIVGTHEYGEDGVVTGEFAWPCLAPEGISSPYGWRDLYGMMDFHLGIDLPGETGDPILASDGGVVVWAAKTPSYGNHVRILHENGTESLYAHLSKIDVEVGDTVYQGQKLGEMGRTGVAYGVHLHFELRLGELNGKTDDPMKYLTPITEPNGEIYAAATAAMQEHYPELFAEPEAN